MSKSRASFGAGASARATGRADTHATQFGNSIQSSMTQVTGANGVLTRYIRKRTFAKNQNVVYCINQLGGVGLNPTRTTFDAQRPCIPYEYPPTPGCVYETIDSLSIDFENYNLAPISDSGSGIIQVPGGPTTQWSGGNQTYFTNDSTDDENIIPHPFCPTGKAWRLKDCYSSAGQGTPFSPNTSFERSFANETNFVTALNEKRVITSFSFASEQPGNGTFSSVNIYSGAYQGNDRTGYNIYFTQTATGVDVASYTYDNGAFALIPIATNLPFETCHTVSISATYDVNNPDNDVFQYTINGGMAVEILSWPNVWRQANGFTSSYGTRMKFAANNTAAQSTGFIFDDISIQIQECNGGGAPAVASAPAMKMGPSDAISVINKNGNGRQQPNL